MRLMRDAVRIVTNLTGSTSHHSSKFHAKRLSTALFLC